MTSTLEDNLECGANCGVLVTGLINCKSERSKNESKQSRPTPLRGHKTYVVGVKIGGLMQDKRSQCLRDKRYCQPGEMEMKSGEATGNRWMT